MKKAQMLAKVLADVQRLETAITEAILAGSHVKVEWVNDGVKEQIEANTPLNKLHNTGAQTFVFTISAYQ